MAAHVVPIMSAPEAIVAPQASQSTQSVINQLNKMSIEQSPVALQRTTVADTSVRITVPRDATARTPYPERKLLRRDSLDSREALPKGKEGSRQRRRWENGICARAQELMRCWLTKFHDRSPPLEPMGRASSAF